MEKSNRHIVYWTTLQHGEWAIPIAATVNGLCYSGPNGSKFEELAAWTAKRLPDHDLVEDADAVHPYVTELLAYLKRESENFTLPLDLHGTPFQQSVWEALREIPFGQTVSYSDIAFRISKPQAVRAVGTAIGANPVLITVPCHRVLAKTGALAGFRGGLAMKKRLLELEKCIYLE